MKNSVNWWLDYSVRGQRHRESSGMASRAEAVRVLRERIGGREKGTLVGRPDQVTFADLRQLPERQYKLDGRRSVVRLQQAFAHLEKYFGADARAVELTAGALDGYAEHRLAQKGRLGKTIARATVNYELAALRRAFRLAIEKGLLATMPLIKLPKPRNSRSGFFEEGEFAAVLLELPADVQDLVKFLRSTGWRLSEGRLLPWAMVDMEGQTIRLEDARSKSGKSRVWPFGSAPALKALLDARWAARDGLYVFHRNGQPVGMGAIRYAWKRAVKRAGLPGRIIHDLRRSMARDFRRAGVSEGEIMQLAGWETRSMFDRYNIIDEADLARAVAKKFNGRDAAEKAPVEQASESLS